MDAQKVDMFLMMNSKFFEAHHLPSVREKLLTLDESRWGMVQTMQFKDPTTAFFYCRWWFFGNRPFLYW